MLGPARLLPARRGWCVGTGLSQSLSQVLGLRAVTLLGSRGVCISVAWMVSVAVPRTGAGCLPMQMPLAVHPCRCTDRGHVPAGPAGRYKAMSSCCISCTWA